MSYVLMHPVHTEVHTTFQCIDAERIWTMRYENVRLNGKHGTLIQNITISSACAVTFGGYFFDAYW